MTDLSITVVDKTASKSAIIFKDILPSTVDILQADFETYLARYASNIPKGQLLAKKAISGEYASLYTRYAWYSWVSCYEYYKKVKDGDSTN